MMKVVCRVGVEDVPLSLYENNSIESRTWIINEYIQVFVFFLLSNKESSLLKKNQLGHLFSMMRLFFNTQNWDNYFSVYFLIIYNNWKFKRKNCGYGNIVKGLFFFLIIFCCYYFVSACLSVCVRLLPNYNKLNYVQFFVSSLAHVLFFFFFFVVAFLTSRRILSSSGFH